MINKKDLVTISHAAKVYKKEVHNIRYYIQYDQINKYTSEGTILHGRAKNGELRVSLSELDLYLKRHREKNQAHRIDGLDDAFKGPTGMVCANEDPLAPARLMAKFAETSDGKPKVKFGYMDGTIYVEEQVAALAKLPTREVLLTQLVTGLQSPITGLACCLSGILQSLVGTIQAVLDKKQNEGGE